MKRLRTTQPTEIVRAMHSRVKERRHVYLQVGEIVFVQQKEERLPRWFQGLVVRPCWSEDEKLADVFEHAVEVGVVHTVKELEGSCDLHFLEGRQGEAQQIVLGIRIPTGAPSKRSGEQNNVAFVASWRKVGRL